MLKAISIECMAYGKPIIDWEELADAERLFKSYLGLTNAFGFVTWARNLESAHAGAQPAVGADLRAARRFRSAARR
ncbi:MAG: hypothetical protein JO232_18275 [Verrucomicrobia bacterium]|nr:hypothetical protein [Verrucomicrobiota bacterium]